MQVVGKNYDGVDTEGMVKSGFHEGRAKTGDMLDQEQVAVAISKINGEEIGAAWILGADVAAHGGFMEWY